MFYVKLETIKCRNLLFKRFGCCLIRGDPLIATAQIGKGRSLVWTSDIGPHWCPEPFVQWKGFAPLMSNMIDWVTGK